MKKSLVESMKRLFDNVPSGVLSFFPSFTFLEELAPQFQKMITHKKIWIEPRDNSKTQNVIDGFNKDAPRGAALLGVCRGKLSEGLDFSDDSARCVCVVGIPYPNLTDYKVQFKRDWLDNKKKGLGSKWYLENAMRAVNQSIGRAIRHINDYAAILLFDDRYLGMQSKLSKWIQPSIHLVRDWNDMIFNLKNFYQMKVNGFSLPENSFDEKVEPAPIFVRSKAVSPASPARMPLKEFTENKHSNKAKFKAIEDLSQIESNHLQLKSNKKSTNLLKQKQSKEEVKADLMMFFNKGLNNKDEKKNSSSRNSFSASLSSALNSQNSSTKSPIKKIGQPLSVDSKIKMEDIVCVFCNHKAKSALKMKRMSCGHYACKDCWEFNEILNAKCPLCNMKIK